MANITTEIAAIEEAARGEEVRDSIISALNKMNSGLNYIIPFEVTVPIASLVSNSQVFSGGYAYAVTKSGITADTYADICLASLSSFVGRYAVQTSANMFTIYFDHMPTNNLDMVIYYFEDATYGTAENNSY